MTKPSWGLRRHCPNCRNPFYDLGKNPASCPKCKFLHDINAPVKPRRGRNKAPVLKEVVQPVKEVAKPEIKAKKKPVKQIEGVDLDEFEDIETTDGEEEIEEIEEIDDIETIEEIDDDEDDKSDDEALLEDDDVGAVLVDDVEDAEEEDDEDDDEDEDEEDEKPRKRTAPKSKPKPKVKPTVRKKPVAVVKAKKRK